MKNKRLKEFLNINTTSERLDQLMKNLLENKFDSDLKSRYEESLKTKYQIVREGRSTKSRQLWKAVAGISLLAALVLSYLFFQQMKPENDQTRIEQYLAENVLLYNGVNRSTDTQLKEIKALAYEDFNKGNYDAFIVKIQESSPLTIEDQFFQAYAKMINKDYSSAVTEFNSINKFLTAGQDYYNESMLYYAICLQITNPQEFTKVYNTIENNSWVKQQLNKLME